MAALRIKEDQAGRVVLQAPLLSGLGSLVSMLVWVGVLAVFLLPSLQGGQIDWANLALVLFFFIVTVGAGLVSSLVRTSITIDPTGRSITSTQSVFGFPVRSTQMSFTQIESIAYDYYRQKSGRYAHDAWRVTAVGHDNRRMVLNWDGKQDEMADLAKKLASRTRAPLVDNSVKPVSTVQQIFDGMKGQPTETEPKAGPVAPPLAQPDSDMGEMPSAGSGPAPAPMPADSATPDYDTMMASTGAPTIPSEQAAEPSAIWNMGIPELEQRVAADPIDSDARYALARKYQARGQLDKAIDLYQRTVQLDPANAGVQNDLGVALQQRGRKAEAEVAYRRAAALDPFSSTAHLNLGLLLRGMNRASEASQEFYQARQNARADKETRLAEAASSGTKIDPQMSTV